MAKKPKPDREPSGLEDDARHEQDQPKGADSKGAASADAAAPATIESGPATWLADPEEHDFPAAAAYLGLIADEATVTATVDALRAAATTFHAAKDILRASRLPLLPPENPHVAHDAKKIARGEALSPVLLVRGDTASDRPLQVADGYHRVCASYHADENTPIPARLAPLGHAGEAAPHDSAAAGSAE